MFGRPRIERHNLVYVCARSGQCSGAVPHPARAACITATSCEDSKVFEVAMKHIVESRELLRCVTEAVI